MLFFIKYFILTFILVNSVCATAYYCDNDYCASPEFYCCGHNECCANVMTMWYFWFALLIGVVIICLLICKYNGRASNELPIIWPSTPSLSSAYKPTNLNDQYDSNYLYKPLRNQDEYLDEKFAYKPNNSNVMSQQNINSIMNNNLNKQTHHQSQIYAQMNPNISTNANLLLLNLNLNSHTNSNNNDMNSIK